MIMSTFQFFYVHDRLYIRVVSGSGEVGATRVFETHNITPTSMPNFTTARKLKKENLRRLGNTPYTKESNNNSSTL